MKKPYRYVLLLAAVAAAGCKSAPEKTDDKESARIAEEEIQKIIKEKGAVVNSKVAEIDISGYVEGRRLHVAIKNQTQQPIIVGPKNLGVLRSDGKLIKFQPHEAGLPVTKLLPGDRIEGLLPLRGLKGPLGAAQLVFKHPQVKEEARTAIGAGPQETPRKQSPAPAPAKP